MSINDANGNLHSNTDGRFTEKSGTRPAGTLTSAPVALVSPNDWERGYMWSNATVTELESVDRPRNYRLVFGDYSSSVSVDPARFGIEKPDSPTRPTEEGDRLHISGWNPTGENRSLGLGVSYTSPVETLMRTDAGNPMEDIGQQEIDEIETEITNAIRAQVPGASRVYFGIDGEPGEDIFLMYSTTINGLPDEDGRTTIDTDTVMDNLEADPAYRFIHDGHADQVIRDVLTRHNITV